MPLGQASDDWDRFTVPANEAPQPLTGVWLERWEHYRQRLEELAAANGGRATRDGYNLALHAPPGYGLCVHVVQQEHEAGRAGVIAGLVAYEATWTLEDDNPYDDLWDVVEALIAGRVSPDTSGEHCYTAELADGREIRSLHRPAPAYTTAWRTADAHEAD